MIRHDIVGVRKEKVILIAPGNMNLSRWFHWFFPSPYFIFSFNIIQEKGRAAFSSLRSEGAKGTRS